MDPGTYANAAAVNHAPDGGFNVRWEDPQAGHVQFGTLFRALGANDPVAGDQTVFGWGMNLAGSLNVWAKDTMQFQATYGHGIFHYINDNFVQTFAATGLSAQHAYTLARNSFEASFIDASAKRGFQDQLDQVLESFF